MDRKVIDPLLCLFDECVAIDFPGQFFRASPDFLERLINRHGADRHRRVANNPFARGVNVLAGGQIHHSIGTPLCRPTHLLDFLFDRRRDRAVSDVGVDLHQEITADDHRLELGMINVRRDDGPSARDLCPHKFRRYFFGNCGTE
jgi:hypothetical protein